MELATQKDVLRATRDATLDIVRAEPERLQEAVESPTASVEYIRETVQRVYERITGEQVDDESMKLFDEHIGPRCQALFTHIHEHPETAWRYLPKLMGGLPALLESADQAACTGVVVADQAVTDQRGWWAWIGRWFG